MFAISHSCLEFRHGLPNDVCDMAISYLNERCPNVEVVDGFSDCTPINRGVPQWSTLSPLLINIFLNDMFYVGMNFDVAKYAYDYHLYYANSCLITL